MIKSILIGLFFVLLSSCTHLKRHASSGYQGPARYDVATSAESYSTNSSVPPGSSVSLADSETLKRKETQLKSEQEIKQYYHYKPLLKTNQQRIDFLNQPTIAARNSYAQNILFPVKKRDFTPAEVELISKRDISLGMSSRAVEESWGNPLERMSAGNSMRGNEIWVYKKLIPTSNGYNTEYRHVYFESSHVAGWETKK